MPNDQTHPLPESDKEWLVIKAGCGHTTLVKRDEDQLPLFCSICFACEDSKRDLDDGDL